MKLWSRIPLFLRTVIVLVAFYLFLKVGIRPPLPGSVVLLYMAFALLGVIIYITLEDERIGQFLAFFVPRKGEGRALVYSRWVSLAMLPLLVAYSIWSSLTPRYTPPAEIYQAHPTPPEGALNVEVPSWAADPARWQAEDIQRGKELYKANCLPCHGENLDGRGPQATGFRYPARPADFRDPGTIAQLTLPYVYWRVSQGGVQNQFNSAMPHWLRGQETVHTGDMSSDEIWRIIIYLYSETGHQPRFSETGHRPHER